MTWAQIFTLLTTIIGWLLERAKEDTENQGQYEEYLKIMNRKGLSTVEMRLKAEDQREDIKKQWEKEQ